ncbi:hypothetical protein [Pseudomonas fluorescens group sp. PF-69]
MSVSKTWSHLLGLPLRSLRASKADDDGPIVEDYNNDDPLDQQYADDEDDDKKARGKKARGKRAEDDDDKPDAEDDDDDVDADDDDEKKPDAKARGKSAKGKRAEDDDVDAEDDDEDDEKKPSAARASERARCARIMAYGMNHGMARQAFALAFDSNVTRATAITVLKANKAASPKTAGRTSLGHSMASLGIHQVAPEGSRELPAGADTAAAMIIKAGQ